MEKQFKEDFFAGKLLRDAGLEKPSAAFSANVMQSLPARKAKMVYEPLITFNGWALIASLFALAMLGFYFVNADNTLSIDFGFLKTLTLPKIEISRTMTYAIGFVSMFLLQIPFLKGLMEREFRF